MLVSLQLLSACAPGELKEGLAPNDAEVVAVAVVLERPSILVGDSVLVWATAVGLDGRAASAEVDWTATGGTLAVLSDSTARFSASAPGAYRVRGRYKKNNKTADSATITVVQPAPVLQAVILTPGSASLATGATQQFSVSGQWSDGATTAPSVTYSATGGSISSNGFYTAGSTAGTFRVIATHQGGGLADTSTVTLTTAPPVLQAVILTPSSTSLATGATRQFSVSGQWNNGATTAPSVAYSATGGVINSNGLYTAGSTAGTFQVIATQQGGSLADTATVTLSVAAPVLQAVILTPSSASLVTGATQQFSVSGQWSDGATTAPSVTYSATGGSISSNGLYTAASTAGTFRVIAAQQGGSLADTAIVTIMIAPTPSPNPNEPAGYAQRVNESFAAAPSAPATQVNDASAPVSAPLVARVTYPVGFAAGHSPWTREWNLQSNKPTSLYYRLAFKLSANFQGQSSETNKLGFVWIHGDPSVFLSAEGSGSGNLIAEFRLQGVPDGRGRLMPNRGASGIITRGNWHTWEVQIISNTPGIANGVARWWLDGVLVGEYTDVQFAGASQGNGWEIISINPIWGGVGGTVSSTMTIDFDNLYASAP